MVSSDGLKTWFDYQLLFVGVAFVFIGVTVAWSRHVTYLGTLPLADLCASTPQTRRSRSRSRGWCPRAFAAGRAGGIAEPRTAITPETTDY